MPATQRGLRAALSAGLAREALRSCHAMMVAGLAAAARASMLVRVFAWRIDVEIMMGVFAVDTLMPRTVSTGMSCAISVVLPAPLQPAKPMIIGLPI